MLLVDGHQKQKSKNDITTALINVVKQFKVLSRFTSKNASVVITNLFPTGFERKERTRGLDFHSRPRRNQCYGGNQQIHSIKSQ